MERVAFDTVEPSAYETSAERRSLSDPLGTTDVALNRYRVAPGDRLAGLHAHPGQEEVFVVLAGEATFETLDWRVGERRADDGGGGLRCPDCGEVVTDPPPREEW
ncbi:cupin domain-containing protein [Halogeometricum sp. S1BR25-6]|uniref:Cupin domain-containing protein n=1 Tax=Halogeometricum salsisoli TaxID=2950536 RepID=A0ABU2GFR9_9EURY|nr:cupin domain-containing protein [Halogeometricum sp. S1BR25-6]MDS0299034.1 cupin domain-containing protein [Halogeometricum sp. S1BR25-6]